MVPVKMRNAAVHAKVMSISTISNVLSESAASCEIGTFPSYCFHVHLVFATLHGPKLGDSELNNKDVCTFVMEIGKDSKA